MKNKICAFLAASLAFCMFTFAPNVEAKTTWKFFSSYGPTEGPCGYIWQELFKKIEQETNGELKIKVFWAGQHPYEGSDMLKAISTGAAQLAHFYGPFVSSAEPLYELEAIPMIMPADSYKTFDILKKLWGNFQGDKSGPLEKVLQERWGASLVHLIPAGAQRLFTKGYAANTPGSLKGHKIRSNSAAMASFISALGGTPINLAWGEIYTGLAQGLIDGTHTSTFFAKSTGFMDICDTVNLWEISAATDGLMVNVEALNALPEEVRKVFLKVMSESAMKPETAELADHALALEQLILEGKKIYTVSKEDRNAVAKQVHETYLPEYIKRGGAEAQQAIDIINSMK